MLLYLLPCLCQQTAKDTLATEVAKSAHHLLSDKLIPVYHHGCWKAADGSKLGFIFRFPDSVCSCQKSLVQSLFKSTIKMSNGVNDLWISSKDCALILAVGLAGDSLWEGCPLKRWFSQNCNFQGQRHPNFEPSFLSEWRNKDTLNFFFFFFSQLRNIFFRASWNKITKLCFGLNVFSKPH